MNFRIADTFTDSLARLSGEEQKAAKMTAFDLQVNPAHPSLKLHRIDHARDKNFWSVRVSGDLRVIVHKSADSLLLCYVDHHQEAYRWAERRKLEAHPTTGAAQLVEIRETVQDIVVPRYVEETRPAPARRPPLAGVSEADLLAYGVPPEWIADLREATEDGLLELAAHLPAEAAEAVLELAVGRRPAPRVAAPAGGDMFAHPDAQRRFRVMSNVEELERALAFPWDKWMIFLHPSQRDLVERSFNGPARVSGSAGTGKTIVALHRAVQLARANKDARVLLTTFSEPLANALRARTARLTGEDRALGDRLEVASLAGFAHRLYMSRFGKPVMLLESQLTQFMKEAIAEVADLRFGLAFLLAEWRDIMDPWHIRAWEAYRAVSRLGRKTRLSEKQRELVWGVFQRVLARIEAAGLVSESGIFTRLATAIPTEPKPVVDHVVVDECQDLGVSELRFLSALGGSRGNALFFTGDLGQRIFQQPFSWKSLGVDIRGRSSTLRVNYRTSHQIRAQADRLLGPELADVDGNVEKRSAVSAFNGPTPIIRSFASERSEIEGVSDWLKTLAAQGVQPHEIGVFVRSASQFERARAAATAAGIEVTILDERLQLLLAHASVGTMHQAKGLEFRAVIVMACDDNVLPDQQRINAVGDDADLEEVHNTERHLLYVACTRARDFLMVSGVEPVSEFIGDLVP